MGCARLMSSASPATAAKQSGRCSTQKSARPFGRLLGSASPQRVWSEHSHASDRDTGLPVCTGPDIGAGCESVPACWCGTSGIQLGAGSGQGEPGTERVRTLLRNIRGVPNAVAKFVAVHNAKGLERRKASDCAMVGRVLERGV